MVGGFAKIVRIAQSVASMMAPTLTGGVDHDKNQIASDCVCETVGGNGDILSTSDRSGGGVQAIRDCADRWRERPAE